MSARKISSIAVGSHEQLAAAGYMAGAFFSETYRVYKRSIKAGINTFFLPSEDADPRYVITRADGRFFIMLEYSAACPRCLVTCLFKNKSDPFQKIELEHLVRDFFLGLERRLRINFGHAYVSDVNLAQRSASALIIGADAETVRRIVDRQAGDNFRRGFGVVVKSASGGQPCPT